VQQNDLSEASEGAGIRNSRGLRSGQRRNDEPWRRLSSSCSIMRAARRCFALEEARDVDVEDVDEVDDEDDDDNDGDEEVDDEGEDDDDDENKELMNPVLGARLPRLLPTASALGAVGADANPASKGLWRRRRLPVRSTFTRGNSRCGISVQSPPSSFFTGPRSPLAPALGRSLRPSDWNRCSLRAFLASSRACAAFFICRCCFLSSARSMRPSRTRRQSSCTLVPCDRSRMRNRNSSSSNKEEEEEEEDQIKDMLAATFKKLEQRVVSSLQSLCPQRCPHHGSRPPSPCAQKIKTNNPAA
jgi:hypothetical protein